MPPDPTPPSSARDLNAAAMQALRGGDIIRGAAMLEQACALDPAYTPAWLNLAGARRARGDLSGALDAVDRALATEPRLFPGLLMRGALLERGGEPRLAAMAYGDALTQAPPADQLDPATAAALQRARAVHDDYQAGKSAALADALNAAPAGPEGVDRRLGTFAERIVRRPRVYHQEPTHFHYPGLPSVEFYDRGLFPWLPAFEAATPAILDELRALLIARADQVTPYLQYPDSAPLDQWAELNQSARWGALHLLQRGERVEANTGACPATMAALAALPQPRLPRRSPVAMFSLLEPRTRIPPHTGVSNTRLVVHLPLIVPPDCGFRVGSETREWRVGEAWVFDDTIEHEAWNDSGEPRVILICDIWSPYLDAAERDGIRRLTAAIDAYDGGDPEQGI